MHIFQDARLGWTVAGVAIVIALALAGFLWYEIDRRTHDMAFILEDAKDEITDARAEIAAECEGSEIDAAACQASLNELAEILRDFSLSIQEARTGVGAGTPAGPRATGELEAEAQ